MCFIDFVKELKNSNCFGNDILYKMCSEDFENFCDANHLGDKIWLIGRAYSASPERRTYGFERSSDGKTKKDDNGKRIPLHKPVSAADGKGAFFTFVAENLIENDKFRCFLNLVKELKNAAYSCDDGDIGILAKSVYAVSIFNELIRYASEKFDCLYDDVYKQARDNGARCKNQISFCSKFLHFHCPDTIFIIDQYSLSGGESLITYNGKKKLYLDRDKSEKTIDIDNEFLLNLRKSFDYNLILQRLKSAYKEIEDNSFNSDTVVFAERSEQRENNIDNYLQHCARGYYMIRYLNNENISARPRLIDDIFLRVKRG